MISLIIGLGTFLSMAALMGKKYGTLGQDA